MPIIESPQTPAQKQAVDTLLHYMQRYCDARSQMVIRVNQDLERVWEDLAFQGLQNLNNSLTHTKPWGPVRFHIGETLVGDDEKKITDIFNPVNQNSIFSEIVDRDDDAGGHAAGGHGHGGGGTKKMEGVLAIHDMQTLFRAIKPEAQTALRMMQCFFWFDIQDAADLARFEIKAQRVKAYQDGMLTDAIRTWYQEMTANKDMANEDVIVYELVQMRKSLDHFLVRRAGDPPFKRIIAREPAAHDQTDQLVLILAQQLVFSQRLAQGQTLEPQVVQQFAQAAGVDPTQLSTDRIRGLLDRAIIDNKGRLRSALTHVFTGKPYNFKDREAVELRARFEQLRGDRVLPEAHHAVASKEVPKDSGTGVRG